uniref:Venom protein n=1 Tax=Ananas comosus var. bracteatus TaxID=296719 RepID=A0A6V7PXQ7_ANACO|nr:unnamed protein product [Ananas comosus var. bracteatus]
MAKLCFLLLTVVSMSTVQLSYTRLLREVYEQLQLEIPCSEFVAEIIRRWGAQSLMSLGAEQDTTHITIKRLTNEYDLHIKNVNYDNSIFYKSLHDHLTMEYAVLFAQCTNLAQESDFLKECYISTIAQKNKFVIERVKIHHAIEECYAIVNHLDVVPSAIAANESDARSNPLA